VEIPTNKPVIREDLQDEIYRTADEKYKAIINTIIDSNRRGQPVLVGTTSVEKSEIVADLLHKAAPDLKFEVLNARHHEREAAIVAQAGVSGAITIATNMAGRGTDIQLGGNPDMKLKERLTGEETPEQIEEIKKQIEAEVAADKEKVLKAGGLYIVGTERHESRRIDNQLRGRSGRQGDPGTSKFFLSMEDDLMRIFGSEKISTVLHRLGLPEGEALVHPWISKALEKAQKKVEERNFDIRKDLLKYDNVMNEQRKIIYAERREIMEQSDVSDIIKEMRDEYLTGIIRAHVPYGTAVEEWNIDGLKQDIQSTTSFSMPVATWCNNPDIDSEKMLELVLAEVDNRLAEREQSLPPQIVKMVQKSILLQVLDQLWKDHIAALDLMRHTIVLRAYGQKDPLNEYKKEAFNMFSDLLDVLKERVTVVICHTVIQTETEQQMQRAMDKEQNRKMSAFHDGAVTSDEEANNDIFANVGRNDLCPCGSGKKFKHCHGKFV
jgi:preprotein translocase subunit SecA